MGVDEDHQEIYGRYPAPTSLESYNTLNSLWIQYLKKSDVLNGIEVLKKLLEISKNIYIELKEKRKPNEDAAEAAACSISKAKTPVGADLLESEPGCQKSNDKLNEKQDDNISGPDCIEAIVGDISPTTQPGKEVQTDISETKSEIIVNYYITSCLLGVVELEAEFTLPGTRKSISQHMELNDRHNESKITVNKSTLIIAKYEEEIRITQAYFPYLATLHNLGNVFIATKQFKEAISMFKSALELVAKEDSLRIDRQLIIKTKLLTALNGLGQQDKVSEFLKEIDEINETGNLEASTRGKIMGTLSHIFAAFGDFDTAIKYGSKMITILNASKFDETAIAEVWFWLGTLYNIKGDAERHLSSIENAFGILRDSENMSFPLMPVVLDELSKLYYRKSNLKKWGDTLIMIIELSPTPQTSHLFPLIKIKALLNLAEIYQEEEMNKYEESIVLLKQACDLCNSLETTEESQNERNSLLANINLHMCLVLHGIGKENDVLLKNLISANSEENIQNHTERSAMCLKISRLFSDKKEYTKAKEFCEQALKIIETYTPEDLEIVAESNCWLGILYGKLKQYENSILYLTKGVGILEQNGLLFSYKEAEITLEALYLSYWEMKEWDKCVETLKKCLQIIETSETLFLLGGILYKFLHKPDEAKVYLEKAISISSTCGILIDIQLLLATIYEEIGKSTLALETLNKVIDLVVFTKEKIDKAHSYFEIAKFFLKVRKYLKARDYFEASLELRNPKSESDNEELGEALNLLGVVEFDLGKFAKSIEHLEESLKKRTEPEEVIETIETLGLVYSKGLEDYYRKSMQIYEKALKLNEESSVTDSTEVARLLNDIGINYRRMGNYEQAELNLNKSLNIILSQKDPAPHQYHIWNTMLELAIAYSLQLQKTSLATETVSKIVEEMNAENNAITIDYLDHEELLGLWDDIAIVYFNLENWEESKVFSNKALEILEQHSPESFTEISIIFHRLSLIWEKLGDHEQCLEFQQKAAKIIAAIG